MLYLLSEADDGPRFTKEEDHRILRRLKFVCAPASDFLFCQRKFRATSKRDPELE
jgi:hypothetical protein